jgi:hypothetical protein
MRFRALPAALLCCVAVSAGAADFDGSRPLLCATVEARDCWSGSPCHDGLADDVGAPRFLRLDFDKKTIVADRRTTAIAAIHKTEQQVLLQGTELGYGWAFAIDTRDGAFSAALTDVSGTFVLFGYCTPQ